MPKGKEPPEEEPEDAPLRRFERLLGQLVQVPKAEVDARRRLADKRRRLKGKAKK